MRAYTLRDRYARRNISLYRKNHWTITGIDLPDSGGFPVAEMWQHIHHEDIGRLNSMVVESKSSAEPNSSRLYRYEYRRIRPDGSICWLEELATAYYDENCDLMRVVGTAHDITSRKQLEAQLAETLQAKNRCLGVIIHDMRSPLTVVKGYLYLLRNPALSRHRFDEILGRMNYACDRLQSIIDELLDLQSVTTGQLHLHLEPVDLAGFMLRCHESFIMLATPKSITVELRLHPASGVGYFDQARMEQVFTNLLSNALKYSHPFSHIMVEALPRHDGLVHVCMRDHGLDIAPEYLTRIFEPFETADNKPTGGEHSTGLGLAICRRIVEEHRGRIWAESEVGLGSTFHVALPAHEPIESHG